MKLWLIRREIKFWLQRRIRGWSDDETWNLDKELSKWIAPRLKRFLELNNGFPGGLESQQWDDMIADMIYAHEHNNYDCELDMTKEDNERMERGLRYFAEYWRHLWW